MGFYSLGCCSLISWTTFTYQSPQIRKVTNLFRNTKIGMAFKATATLQFIRPTTQNLKSDYENSGIYKIHARLATNPTWDKLVVI
jgi:hypothetical protein